jgi:hypothetical protein
VGYAEDDPDTKARLTAFREAFEQLGWKDGSNVAITYRFGVGDIERVRGYARELVNANPDVIVCETTPTLRAVADQTSTIPTVFVSVTDPVTMDSSPTSRTPAATSPVSPISKRAWAASGSSCSRRSRRPRPGSASSSIRIPRRAVVVSF